MRPLPSRTVRNTVRHDDCVQLMRRMDAASVDFILTDPPYICRYRDSSGRTIANDDNSRWLEPAFAEMFRLLKPDSFAVSFYGWNQVDRFVTAWRQAGFRLVGHMVFPKPYASSERSLSHRHEQDFLLAKGEPEKPAEAISDVRNWAWHRQPSPPDPEALRSPWKPSGPWSRPSAPRAAWSSPRSAVPAPAFAPRSTRVATFSASSSTTGTTGPPVAGWTSSRRGERLKPVQPRKGLFFWIYAALAARLP